MKIGVTLAIFIFSGNDPLSMEFLNTSIKGAFISLYADLSTFICNSSKPDLLSFFKTEMHLQILSRLILYD